MSAIDHQKLIDDQGKWTFIYKQMMYSSTFNKLRDKIDVFQKDKEKREQERLMEEYDQMNRRKRH